MGPKGPVNGIGMLIPKVGQEFKSQNYFWSWLATKKLALVHPNVYEIA